MSISYARFIVVLIACACSMQSKAQQPGYKYFKLEKDNRQVRINTLFKTSQGYIHAGTDQGLYKFDGEKYTAINFENPDYTDTVTALFQDKKEKIWVGFKSGRLATITNKKLHYFDPEEGTPKKKITAFLQDKANNLWFSTSGEGIYFTRDKHIYLLNTDDGLSDPNVSTMVLTDNGDVLAGTDQGINICAVSNGKKQVAVIGPREGLPDYMVTSIIAAGNNRYWIGLQDKGFCLYDHGTRKIQTPAALPAWSYGEINSLLLTGDILWIATQEQGLYKYTISKNELTKMPASVVGNQVQQMLEDRQGNVWLSSSTLGMIRTPGETLKLMPIPGNPVFEHIHAILCDSDGNTWLNDELNNLVRISIQNEMPVAKKIRLPGLTDKTDITALYQDSQENIWVGTIGKGLFIIDPHDLQQRSFHENPLFIDAGILSISGRGNSVYVSSLQGAMLIELSPVNKDIHAPYQFKNYDNNSTGTNYIYSIFKDSRDRTWFATDGKGLTMLSQHNFTYYNNKEQIKDDRIYSITEDSSGNIWFSTASAGLYKFDGKTFRNYGLNEGLSDLNISVLKTDRAGKIIIVNKKGLDILDPLSGNISYMNNSQGIAMVNAEDIGAVTKDTSGNVMVSTVNGILTYQYPVGSKQVPTALIESVQLFLTDLDEQASNVFDHDENNFTFNYTGLYYTDPDKVYYQYKLEGLDSGWIVTKDRSKNFPKLRPGKYTFRIQSSLNKNFQHAGEASYSFVIRQAFYKTAWFMLLCTLIAVGLTYWYIRTREASLKRIERLRQEKIQFQFEILRNQVNPHFLFNSFNTLISTIEEDPKMAVEYTENLSDFFRNIVNQRETDTITLGDEIDALQSYSFLQQKRYGNSLQVNIDLSETGRSQYKIPPLTLQLLVENAIKHNSVSKESVLTINISLEDDYLLVKNNLNARINNMAGTGMGLQNIINRYELLTKKPVKVTNNGQYFIVSLPLLK